MSLRKYQSVEKADVLPREQQQAIREGVTRLGKTSARELSEDERRKVLDTHRK
jgi:hypothetical protein